MTSSNLLDCTTGRSAGLAPLRMRPDRKSTRLNSSHSQISYAVFCLKKKNKLPMPPMMTMLYEVTEAASPIEGEKRRKADTSATYEPTQAAPRQQATADPCRTLASIT